MEKKFFKDEPTEMSFVLQKKKIDLKVLPEVFPPSSFVIPFAQHIEIKENDRVLDVGTGSGILAIMAAKLGAEVFATDINQSAIDNTIENAKLNKVELEAWQGSYFGGKEQNMKL